MPLSLSHSGDPACFTNGTALEVSAYRFHEEDPLAFADGVPTFPCDSFESVCMYRKALL